MASRFRQFAKSFILGIRPPVLIAVLAGMVVMTIALSVFLNGLNEPAPSRATTKSLDQAQAAALFADAQGLVDTDGDGLSDTLENFVYGTDPNSYNTSGSRIPDSWLIRYGLDPFSSSIEHEPAAVPPFSLLPPSYRNRWPASFTPTLWEIYSHGRPANWSEQDQGAFESGLDPTSWDSSDDGIPDGYLLHYDLDPLDASVVDDFLAGPQGLSVRDAYRYGTDPRSLDTDADGIPDKTEVEGPPSPGGARLPASDPRRFDSSGTGVCDGYLAAHGLDPSLPSAALGDLDLDGASTRQEYNWSVGKFTAAQVCKGISGLDPTNAHSGGSTLLDGWLIRYQLDPFESGVAGRETQRSDTDPKPTHPAEPAACPAADVRRLTVRDEYNQSRPTEWDELRNGPWWGGTNPSSVDTDQDGIGDAYELRGFCVQVVTDPIQNQTVTYRVASDPTRADSDMDGFPDAHEISPALRVGSAKDFGILDPTRRDTDFDGIPDGKEAGLNLKLDPTRADSAGDLLRDGERLKLLEGRAKQDGQAPQADYRFPGSPTMTRSVADVAETLPGWANATGAGVGARITSLFGPGGDVDGDTIPNIIDRDIDDDGLLNGWETRPALYEFSPFGIGPFQGRSATDALNKDTDADLLDDGWEIQFGLADAVARDFNLNPSKWDSDVPPDGVSDGDEDSDLDSIEWYSYHGSVASATGQNHTFAFTNQKEQQYGTDPNQFDSDGDGLADGWKVFWGLVYPALGPQERGTIYPGAPNQFSPPVQLQPKLKTKQNDVVLARQEYNRFVLDQNLATEAEPWIPPAFENIPLADGTTRTVYKLTGSVTFGFREAQQAETNPYLLDTDGDGMSDAWEFAHRAPLTDPDLADVCVDAPIPDPVSGDGTLDPDADGLSNFGEFEKNGDPLCPDTDLGGIADGAEGSFGSLSPANPADDAVVIRDSRIDSDCDGVFDSKELVGYKPSWRGDVARGFQTDPHDPDSDGDGLLDGPNQPESGGFGVSDPCAQYFFDMGIAYRQRSDGTFVFFGESGSSSLPFLANPNDARDSPTGIPGGWLAAHSLDPRSGDNSLRGYYEFARPPFWDETVHGPWWGGADPNTTGTADPRRIDLVKLEGEVDADLDVLIDHDGIAGYEDPAPGANGANVFRPLSRPSGLHASITYPSGATDPDNGTHPPLERRLKAQAYLNGRTIGSHYLQYNPPDQPARPIPCISVQGSTERALTKGEVHTIQGRVFSCASTTGTPGITVEARMGEPSQVFGAAVSDLNGDFSIPLNISANHSLVMPSHGFVFRGVTEGTIPWAPNPSAVVPGENLLIIRTYATPQRSSEFPHAPLPALQSTKTILSTIVDATTSVQATLPDFVVTGGSFEVTLHESDSGGTPLADPLVVSWNGADRTVVPNSAGEVSFTLPAPHSLAGVRTFSVVSQPQGPTRDFVTPADTEFSVSLRTPVQVRLDPVPARTDAGQSITVGGSVQGPTGPIANAATTVNIQRGGSTVASQLVNSNAAGRFVADLTVPASGAPGNYVISAAVAASASSVAATNETSIAVRSIPRFIDVDTENLTLGEPASISGRLVEPNGIPIPSVPLSFTLGGRSNATTTGEDGTFNVGIEGVRTRGLIDQTISFVGDVAHVPTSTLNQRLVVSASQLSLPSGETPRGARVEIPIQVADAAGEPVPGAVVRVRWGNDAPIDVVTSPAGFANFGRDVPVSTLLGAVPVRAEFAGSRDLTIGPTNNASVWTVTDGLIIDAHSTTYNASEPVPTAILIDPVRKTPLPGLPVSLYHSNSTQPENKTTDAAGRVELESPAGMDAEPFRDELRIVFPGNENYGFSQKAVVIQMKSPVTLNLSSSQSMVIGRTASAWVELVDGRGLAVDDGLVHLVIGGVEVASAKPENGTARLSFTVPTDLPAGSTVLEARFSGSDVHAPAESSRPTRLASPIELTIRVEAGLAGRTSKIFVTARNEAGPVEGAVLTLNMAGLPAGLRGETGKDGVAEFVFPQQGTPTPYAIRFEGNATAAAAGSSGILRPLTLLEAAAPAATSVVWFLQAGIVILVILGFLALQLRRHPIAPSLGRARRVLRGRGPIETRILRAYQILQDAAISAELLDAPAATPGLLGDVLAPRIQEEVWPALDRLITLFEVARYGTDPLTTKHRDVAVHSLDELIDAFASFNPIWNREAKASPKPA